MCLRTKFNFLYVNELFRAYNKCTRKWCPLAVRMEIVRHHIDVVHVLIDFGHVVRKVDDSLGRRSGQAQQIRATFTLVLASDFVQKLRQMLTLSIGGRWKFPVQIDAVQMELLQSSLQRSNELHSIGVIGDHLLESSRFGATDPNEYFETGILGLQVANRLKGLADGLVDEQLVVLNPDHAHVYVRT